ncbi:FAD:protein FMN transferase [Miltoncostaea marina]|uniref:FAD:protein FMN transferase n=1 Tax=Miltoncostaea marina TaxID=2843215 RepID=UPI001C3C3A8A|nr:FAD:protein FMN transferase [Miltoncostaea marina]
MLRERFHAMGTGMELVVDAPDGPLARAALAAARAEVARLERLLSRFRPGSELSRLNRERRMHVGADLMRVLVAALDLRRRTAGRFDPTLGRAMWAWGYDRTFERVADDPRPAPRAPAGGAVALDRRRGWVALGPGAELDLGAIAKGDAADRAAALLAQAGPCLVDAGGDLVVSGPRAAGPWPVAVEGPGGPTVLMLERGAVATSGVDRRRWRRGGREAHHAMAPGRGAPADTDLVRASAVASTGAEADALATALLVAGADGARALADDWRVPAVLVAGDGGVALAGGLR